MSDPARVARWWGPAGFTNTMHKFEFAPGGSWLLTMHGPDGASYPNESRFIRIVADRLFEIEHLDGHHFLLTIELHPHAGGTEVKWRQTFDTVETTADWQFVACANEQNLERLAGEVWVGRVAPDPCGVSHGVVADALVGFERRVAREPAQTMRAFLLGGWALGVRTADARVMLDV